jgi:serine/threonine protein kinase
VQAGQRIGKYVLGERIAVGGMAEVWAARVEGPQGFVKPVALKFILESFRGDPELERLFVNEARIAAQLQHANLVTVFDFDKIGPDLAPELAGRYYIAMERVEGHDLRRLSQAARNAGYVVPEPVAVYLAGEVLKGLRYVHERRENGRALRLVHRDVSPHNVLLGYSGEVKLSDFGIAKAIAHSQGTKTGTIRGKLSYASPEQLSGETVDHRTDQFALGVTLWEVLTGRRLFEGNDELEIVGKVLRCEIPPMTAGGRGDGQRPVSAGVEAVVRRMLAPRRDDRFQSTADALSALLAVRSYTGDGAPLSDLMRTLFSPSAMDMPHTMPLQEVAARGASARLAETKTMHGAPTAGLLPVTPARPTPSGTTGRGTPSVIAARSVSSGAGTVVLEDSVPTADVRAGARRLWVGVGVVGAGLVAALTLWLRSSTREPTTTAVPAPAPATTRVALPPPPDQPGPVAPAAEPSVAPVIPAPPIPEEMVPPKRARASKHRRPASQVAVPPAPAPAAAPSPNVEPSVPVTAPARPRANRSPIID